MGFHLFTFANLSFKQIHESGKKNPLFNDVCQLDIRGKYGHYRDFSKPENLSYNRSNWLLPIASSKYTALFFISQVMYVHF